MGKQNIFDEVENIRSRVMKDVFANQNLLKLVSIKRSDAIESDDIKNIGALVDNCIFFKPKVFEKTITEVQNFLLTDFSVTATYNRVDYSDIKLTFRVLVHNTLYELDDGRARVYAIAKELVSMFGGATGTWLGKSEFTSCYQIEAPIEYQALEVSFIITDFR